MKQVLTPLAFLLCLSNIALASPGISPRPQMRDGGVPDRAVIITKTISKLAPAASIRPQSRSPLPDFAIAQSAPSKVAVRRAGIQFSPVLPDMTSLRPAKRPGSGRSLPDAAPAQETLAMSRTGRRGAPGKICRNRRIQGWQVARIRSETRGCGIAKPVEVFSVDGVRLNQPAIMQCETAEALNEWVRKGVKPAIGRLGGGVASLNIAAGYACRTRNSQRGAKISEHGKGNAVDISAINLKNGKSIVVESGWRQRADGRLLRRMHKSACGPFGTVLGPDADRYHQDHFHFDVARYSSGPFCQ